MYSEKFNFKAEKVRKEKSKKNVSKMSKRIFKKKKKL